MNPARLRRFIGDMTSLVGGAWQDNDETATVEVGAKLLGELVKNDDWLPEAMAECPPHGYVQNLLWCDPFERFSVVSFVWGPGQRTPVHDHTVWGLVGVMRGAERCEEYAPPIDGQPMRKTGEHVVEPGGIDAVSPTVGDVHVVSNALDDRPSVSIHVYGANIGAVRRHVFDPATGTAREFVSGYHSEVVPNLWDCSR
ncbi:MAG: cysteine dioxygenase [Enhydrobacter sp.]|nr:cysteine dioxygenase [Enhydrobacter sp.]